MDSTDVLPVPIIIRRTVDQGYMPSRITPLHCGTLTLDKSILTALVDRGVEVAAPSISYLIEGQELILVDTGFGDCDRMAELHPAFECRREEGTAQPPVDHLEERGYAPDDVDRIVLTHLHWDHCYNLDPFARAGTTIHVPRPELEYAIAPDPHHAVGYDATSIGRTPPWLRHPLEPLTGETKLGPDVTVFPTPGHTVGHQSVAVDTGTRTVVAASDAVPTAENLAGTADLEFMPGLSTNDRVWWDSAKKVAARADKVLPGHEWGILDTNPPAEAEPLLQEDLELTPDGE